MSAKYEVISPLVIVRDETGASHYLYTGAHVPDYVTDERIKELADEKHIRKVGSSVQPKLEADAEAARADVAKADEAPAKNGSLEAWQKFAASKGATEADLEGKGRDDLVAAYGS